MAEKKKEYTSFSDMFDGGGPGASGPTFEGGGIISAIGNSLGGPSIFGNAFVSGDDAPGGGTRIKHSQPVGFMTDAFDGGGFGYSGDYFSDGPYSMIANILGIKPMGSDGLAQNGAQDPEIFAPQEPPFATASNPGETGDPLAAANQPDRFPGMAATSAPFAVPTFSEFSQSPAVSPLSDMAQMKMYEALYGQQRDPIYDMMPGEAPIPVENYESTALQHRPRFDHPYSYRSTHLHEARDANYDRELARNIAEGNAFYVGNRSMGDRLSPEGDARYYAQKRMMYPGLSMLDTDLGQLMPPMYDFSRNSGPR